MISCVGPQFYHVMEVYGRSVNRALGCGCLPPFERLLQVVQGAGDLVGKQFALFAKNDVLVIGKRKFATSAEALPQQHG